MSAVKDNQVLVFGGADVSDENMTSVLAWNPRIPDKWQSRTSLPAARIQGGAAVFQNEVCVAGGYRGVVHFHEIQAEMVKSVECFDGTGWEEVSSLPSPVTFPAVTTFLNRFFVIGGVDIAVNVNVSLSRVQAFDGQNWVKSYDPSIFLSV